MGRDETGMNGYPHTLLGVARELDMANPRDVLTVATAELGPVDYEDELGRVSDHGREILLTHFRGGADPDDFEEHR
jgi:hypothetical protein